MLTVKITPNDKGNPPGKLADAELHFEGITDSADFARDLGDGLSNGRPFDTLAIGLQMLGALDGLKLIGFSIWERRTCGGRNVTFPARQYSVNGERRSFALLRPTTDTGAQDRIRDLILAAYAEYEHEQDTATA